MTLSQTQTFDHVFSSFIILQLEVLNSCTFQNTKQYQSQRLIQSLLWYTKQNLKELWFIFQPNVKIWTVNFGRRNEQQTTNNFSYSRHWNAKHNFLEKVVVHFLRPHVYKIKIGNFYNAETNNYQLNVSK